MNRRKDKNVFYLSRLQLETRRKLCKREWIGSGVNQKLQRQLLMRIKTPMK